MRRRRDENSIGHVRATEGQRTAHSVVRDERLCRRTEANQAGEEQSGGHRHAAPRIFRLALPLGGGESVGGKPRGVQV